MANTFAKKFKRGLFSLLHPQEQDETGRAVARAQLPPLPGRVSDVLRSPEWRPIFENYVTANHAGEVVNFIRDVEAYDAAPSTAELVRIVDEYIVAGARQEVLINNYHITQALIQARNNPPNPLPPNLFAAAYGEAEGMLAGRLNTFGGIANSAQIDQYL